jgi:hypothetical protein
MASRLACVPTVAVAVFLLALAATPTARAQPPPDLKGALLTADDLGPEWSLLLEQTLLPGGVLGYTAGFIRLRPPAATLLVSVFNDPAGAVRPQDVLDPFVESLRADARGATVTAEPAAAPALGDEAARLAISITGQPPVNRGDAIAWRRGPVLALVAVLSAEETSVLPFAEQQDRKLVSFLSPASMSAAPAPAFLAITSVPPGGTASVTVRAAASARCSIEVRPSSGTPVLAPGLEDRAADPAGIVTWSWPVDERTPRGAGSVRVTCDGVSITAPIHVL